jgi:hypothetical protein
MDESGFNYNTLRIIEKIQVDLKEIELSCLDSLAKEKINKLLSCMEQEIKCNKSIFSEMLLQKIKQTKGMYPELNANFYILYRNFVNGKISYKDAQDIYEMYVKELSAHDSQVSISKRI